MLYMYMLIMYTFSFPILVSNVIGVYVHQMYHITPVSLHCKGCLENCHYNRSVTKHILTLQYYIFNRYILF